MDNIIESKELEDDDDEQDEELPIYSAQALNPSDSSALAVAHTTDSSQELGAVIPEQAAYSHHPIMHIKTEAVENSGEESGPTEDRWNRPHVESIASIDVAQEEAAGVQDVAGGIVDGPEIDMNPDGALNEDLNDEDEDLDGDDGFNVVINSSSQYDSLTNRARRFQKGSNKYVRGELTTSNSMDVNAEAQVTLSEQAQKLRDELNALRYTYHRTAFDVDIDALEEKPWRNPGVDISDFFNYGFTEATWRIYCEKQLRHRAAHGEKDPKDTQTSKSNSSGTQRPQNSRNTTGRAANMSSQSIPINTFKREIAQTELLGSINREERGDTIRAPPREIDSMDGQAETKMPETDGIKDEHRWDHGMRFGHPGPGNAPFPMMQGFGMQPGMDMGMMQHMGGMGPRQMGQAPPPMSSRDTIYGPGAGREGMNDWGRDDRSRKRPRSGR